MESNQSLFNLTQILGKAEQGKRRTKIVCTIGPACWEIDTLVKMMDEGMCVARLNFSHGDHKGHLETLKKLQEAQKLRKNNPLAIMLDTKGPEIRTGNLKDNKPVNLKKGQDLILTTANYDTFLGDETTIGCSYTALPKSVKVGSDILIADGTITCTVKSIQEDGVTVIVNNDALLGVKKNMNLPGCIVELPTITEKDQDDFENFAVKYSVDMIALSFTRTAEDIRTARDILGPLGSNIQIIAKIENQDGLKNFDEILKEADGIMVARGDLGMEIPTQKVFIAQKWMIQKANQAGKPIITATQMMESMIKNPRPTRAEASDVANSVLDGTDAVMLSGETANGAFPVVCVQTMASICREAELCLDHESNYWTRIKKQLGQKIEMLESLSISAVQMSFQTKAPIIICMTKSGYMAKLLAKYRPNAYIIAVSTEQSTMKGLNISSGVVCLKVPSFQGLFKIIEYAMYNAVDMGYCKEGDDCIIVMGRIDEDAEGRDIIKVRTIPKREVK